METLFLQRLLTVTCEVPLRPRADTYYHGYTPNVLITDLLQALFIPL